MFALARCTAPCARARGEPSGDGEPFMDLAKFIDKIVARFIGTKHERDIKKLMPVIAAINALETGAGSGVGGGVGGPGDGGIRSLSDEALRARFAELRAQVQEQLKDADPAESAYKEQLQQALEPAIVPAFACSESGGPLRGPMRTRGQSRAPALAATALCTRIPLDRRLSTARAPEREVPQSAS